MDKKYISLKNVYDAVSRETYEKLLVFERMFLKWNASINLVAPSTLDEFWDRHIIDSAQLASLIEDRQVCVDLGSGGGFPGLVLAILFSDQNAKSFNFIESNKKKASFLTLVTAELGLNATVFAQRIESVYREIPTADAITSRALADLDLLLTLAFPLLSAAAIAVFPKGREYRVEIEKSRHNWSYDLIEHSSRTSCEGVILEISNVKRTAEV